MIENNLYLVLAGLCLFVSGYCVGMFRMNKFKTQFNYAVYLAVQGFTLSQELLDKLTKNHR